METPEAPTILSMRGIHLSYGETPALNGVDFDLYRGEIHALVGEHRAGKSTLAKIIAGAERRREGTISLEGRPVGHITPISAAKAGIGIVYQHNAAIPDLDAVENIFTGVMIQKPFFMLNRRTMEHRTCAIFERLDYDIDLHAPLHRLSMAQQHMVEFARALMIEPKVLILDELSNKLTPEEMKRIYRILFELREQGRSVIYISHDMDEVLRLADRVTILKNGYRRETTQTKDLDRLRLFQLTYSFSITREQLEYTESSFDLLKKHLEAIIQNFPIGVMLIDTNKIVRLLNFAAIDILSFKRNPAIDRSAIDLFEAVPARTLAEISAALVCAESRSWEEVELDNGKTLRFDLFPLTDSEGVPIGSTFVLQDISLDKFLPEYLLQSEKMASVAEVAVGVAHEINNPLFIIQNYMELVKAKDHDPDVVDKISRIETELERIVEIVSSLLSFSRLKAPQESRVDIGELMNETLLLMSHAFAEKRISLTTNIAAERPLVAGEANKLKQLFMNLIGNSVEAVLDRGSIEVSVYDAKAEDSVGVDIRDNGSGIPDDVRDRIFSPFFSTKISKKNTGLGLSICRHIVEEHSGKIDFKSVPGRSTTFTVLLPRARED